MFTAYAVRKMLKRDFWEGDLKLDPKGDPMLGIKINTAAIKSGVRVIKTLITVQSRARTRLVNDLTTVCDKCDEAYGSLLARLKPVRAAARDPLKLAAELHSLAGDASARRKFKPERLCSEIDKLLLDLSSNVSALKYSVNVFSIEEIRGTLQSMGNYDQALFHQYDGLMSELNSIATAIEGGKPRQLAPMVAHALATIEDVQQDLREALRDIRKAKAEIVAIA